ncbi:pyrroline-5-carboxylate reductase [Thalassovita gelatinovora]|uniref:Pyrroline-5-carboxylate reductase n=1 Tax=Thalassovita gelatinovora TaxID=53501 RepID=A0A0P1F7N2_THAGE|nr:NAD(P)-binding domain-containing protein [Thalassovita gelatinovora]QIZ80149.1 NAD(P)-binding domain-containing protein [Thalassovita gelatinovora]CUH63941.1 pyrroline-5-carboxylate reductase [Thalassovita gelatinovora]SEQ80409.1 pyrroline-5-carboxylate reductase [Thalassovita gelatinovora]
MRIGVLGLGTIASAVVEGIAGDGHTITVSKRSAAHAQRLSNRFDNVSVADNQQVLEDSEVVILGLLADAASEILPGLTFRADQQVITLMAGASLGEVAAMVAPADAVAIMMPFPGIVGGGSPIMAQGEIGLVNAIFGGRNTVYEIRDAGEMAAYLAAQAVLSPAVTLVSDAARWLGARVSDPDQAETFLRHLVGSSLQGSDCAAMLGAIDTPGGYNQLLRNHMQQSGMSNDLIAGLAKLASHD